MLRVGSLKVSICCITYNHGDYIDKAIKSFISQKTSFEYEILIHDDASKDNTTEIILEYEKKYPNIIKPIIQRDNQYSKGYRLMQTRYNIPRARGKYIAMCEGDDYWTDENKLQRQVDFLESNPEYSFCFHQVEKLYEDGARVKLPKKDDDWHFKRKDLYEANIVPTCSVMFRNQDMPDPSKKRGIPFGDWLMHLHNIGQNKGYYMAQSMGVYRIHEGGYWSSQGRLRQLESILTALPYIQEHLVETPEEMTHFKYARAGHYKNVISYSIRFISVSKAIHYLYRMIKEIGPVEMVKYMIRKKSYNR